MKIQFLSFDGCPTAPAARRLLEDCLRELDLRLPIEDLRGDYPSPTILIDGRDVMDAVPPVASCRLDPPSRERILRALARRLK